MGKAWVRVYLTDSMPLKRQRLGEVIWQNKGNQWKIWEPRDQPELGQYKSTHEDSLER